MLLFLRVALLAQRNAVDADTGWLWLDYLGRLILICLLTVRLVDTPGRFHMTVLVMGVSFGVHAANRGLAALLAGGRHITDGLGGPWSGSDGFALGTVMVSFLLIGAAQQSASYIKRFALLAMVPFCAMSVIFTFSRGAFLALIVSLFAFALLQKRTTLALVGLALAGLIGAAVVPVSREYLDRVSTIRTYEEVGDDSALGRLHFWRVAINMAKDNPTGVGLRNYEAAYDRYDFLQGRFGNGRAVHSSYFQVLAETGFAGLAIYVALFGFAAATLLRIRRAKYPSDDERRFFRSSANALLCSMIAFMVGGAFLSLALNDLSWLTFALVAALDRLSATALTCGTLVASNPTVAAAFPHSFGASTGTL